MIITFCGHADFHKTPELGDRMLSLLTEHIGDAPVEFFLGDYGGFDGFALEMTLRHKRNHPQVSLVFVTPYLSESYQRKHDTDHFDSILYPPLENVPPRFAITHRNRYMAESADLVIAYVCRQRGGAYQTLRHAERKGKTILNLAVNP